MPAQATDTNVRERTLGHLLTGLVEEHLWQAHADRRVAGVFDDSRRVQADGIFVAIPGTATDGRRYVDEAVRRGATVIVGQDVPPRPGVLVLNVSDAPAVLARLAVRWHGLDVSPGGAGVSPASRMKLIGITGTNGKTTTAMMLQSIVKAAGYACGLLGTVRYDLCGRSVTADLTTPGALGLAGYLRECADHGAAACVMEVSSHALDQRRTAGLRFDAAGFTNLTPDHLDYHKTFEAYAAAKARLFAGLDASGVAVVNRDDPHAERMVRDCRARVVWYSLTRRDADIRGALTRDTISGTFYHLWIDGHDLVLENALLGRHNVYNALAAAGLARALELPLAAIEAGLRDVRNIPGRLQRVQCARGVEVFVDYAHTEDALRNVLSFLKPLTRGRLYVVFGCGGGRYEEKRPRMAAVAGELADRIVVTSDNPRKEDPQKIIENILAGFTAAARPRVTVEPDRARAIRLALSAAEPGDVVLIAGKGHETYQILGDRRVHFDDVEEVLRAEADLARQPRGEA